MSLWVAAKIQVTMVIHPIIENLCMELAIIYKYCTSWLVHRNNITFFKPSPAHFIAVRKRAETEMSHLKWTELFDSERRINEGLHGHDEKLIEAFSCVSVNIHQLDFYFIYLLCRNFPSLKQKRADISAADLRVKFHLSLLLDL